MKLIHNIPGIDARICWHSHLRVICTRTCSDRISPKPLLLLLMLLLLKGLLVILSLLLIILPLLILNSIALHVILLRLWRLLRVSGLEIRVRASISSTVPHSRGIPSARIHFDSKKQYNTLRASNRPSQSRKK